jgi:signal transduction histidine kinase
MSHRLSIRTRLFLIVLIGAVLPLAIVGVWLARSAARSGEALLRERLDESLRRVAADVGGRWVPERSELITLSEHPIVQLAVQSTGDVSIDVEALQATYSRLERSVETVVARTSDNRRLTLFDSRSAASGTDSVAVTALIDIYDGAGGRRIGVLEARVRIASLIPVSTTFHAAAGTILQVIDRPSRVSLLPVPFEASLVLQDEFTWQGERWLSVRTSIQEPEIDLVVSAPVTSFSQPFEAAGRRGLAGLAMVLGFVLIVTTVLTRQTTQSLRSLSDAATAIAQGDYGRTVPVGHPDEVGRVASAFNEMSASLRRTLDELAQRQSFAAVGEFAASLAHEVRNPLTSIRLDLQRLEEKVAGEPRLGEVVGRALRAVVRLDATVTGALRVARSGSLTLEKLDIREPIETAIKDVDVECRTRGIELTLNGHAANTIINGDQSALHQMFLNLLLNAAQAIDSGGRIHVSIDAGADAVCVTVSDSGSGIAADVRRRIFDPLFSTKTQGSGLGLPIAQRIVAAHGGELRLDSQRGQGTAVVVTLPLAPQS